MIGGGRQPADVLDAVGLAVPDRAALLDAPVPADPQHLAVDDQCGPDRDPTLLPSETGLLDRELHEDQMLVVLHVVSTPFVGWTLSSV